MTKATESKTLRNDEGHATGEFLKWYLERGFGTMNKNDFEVWIFHYLLKTRYAGQSNYQISIALQIPESKVKRLRYEAELKYSSATEDERKELLARKIKKAKFQGTKEGQIRFSLDDKLLRSYLQDVLTADGRFYDSSFVSSIIVLSVNDFLFLLQQVYLDDWEAMLKKAKLYIKGPKTLPKSFAEALGDAGKGFCKKLLEKFVDDAAGDIVDCIERTIKGLSTEKQQ